MKPLDTIINDLKKVKLYDKSSLELIQDYTRNGKVSVLKDKKRKFFFLDKILTSSNNYYGNKYHEIHSNEKNWQGKFYGRKIITPKLDENNKRFGIFKKNIKNKKILDFGCGYGEFASFVSKYTKKTYVYEKSEICKKFIKKNYKKINLLNSLKGYDNFFDSIILIQTLHYLSNPIDYLSLLKKKLKPKGKILIEVPSSNDILLSKFNIKDFKDFTFCIESLIWHNNLTLKKFLIKAKFKKIKIIPFQRYNLNNHLGWLLYGKPGGHKFLKKFCEKKQLTKYENFLKKNNLTDTLIAIAEK